MSEALEEAKGLNDIGFVEFTVSLINGVVDAMAGATHKQIQDYVGLLKEASQTLGEYTSSELTALIGQNSLDTSTLLSIANIEALATLTPAINNSTTDDDVTTTNLEPLFSEPGEPNEALFSPSATGSSPYKFTNQSSPSQILALVTDKHQILQEMVKMGFSRIVLDRGTIESRLMFNTSTSRVNQSSSSTTDASSFAIAGTLKARYKKIADLSISAGYSRMNVRTANEYHRDVFGSSVQIFGRVELVLKSDYQPLNTSVLK
jgi:hypothetical protein